MNRQNILTRQKAVEDYIEVREIQIRTNEEGFVSNGNLF